MKLQELVEVLDLNSASEYSLNQKVKEVVKNAISSISQLEGYSFKVDNKIYGVYHFSRNGHFELHFYDGVEARSTPIRSKSKISLKVYSTIFKILLDKINDGTVDQSIHIGYDGTEMKRIYEKLINHAFKKYGLSTKFNDLIEYGHLVEGTDCIIIVKKQMMESCIIGLVL